MIKELWQYVIDCLQYQCNPLDFGNESNEPYQSKER